MLWSAISLMSSTAPLIFLTCLSIWIHHNHLEELVKICPRKQTSSEYDFFKYWTLPGNLLLWPVPQMILLWTQVWNPMHYDLAIEIIFFLITSSSSTSKIPFLANKHAQISPYSAQSSDIIFPMDSWPERRVYNIQPTSSTSNFLISCNLSFLYATETASVSTKFSGLFSVLFFLFGFPIIQH